MADCRPDCRFYSDHDFYSTRAVCKANPYNSAFTKNQIRKCDLEKHIGKQKSVLDNMVNAFMEIFAQPPVCLDQKECDERKASQER